MNLTEANRTVTHSTFVIERRLNFPAERVYLALSDATYKQRWYATGRSTNLEQFEMDFRPGGRDRALFRFAEGSPFPGAPLLYESVYQDIIPNRRIVYAYGMSVGGRCVSASLVTFELLPSETGTDLIFTEQGAYFEGSGGPQMREQGWQGLLDQLATEVARSHE